MIFIFFLSGCFCQSEEKRFGEVDHRSHAAEGVSAQGPKWRPDENATQSSCSSDKYASIKLKPVAENSIKGFDQFAERL